MNEENIKNAFSKVKENIEQLKTDISLSNSAINEQNSSISALNSKISELLAILNDIKTQVSIGNQGVQSINHSAINQSHAEHSEDFREIDQFKPQVAQNPEEWTKHSEKRIKHSEKWTEHSEKRIKHSEDFRKPFTQQANQVFSAFSKVRELNEVLSKTFQSLTNQEFKVFLTVYQLEDEQGSVSYHDVAAKTSLTSGCIRGYVSTLILKGTPIIKTRLKNRQTSLTIDKSFRMLNLKDKLIKLYYQQDPNQTTFLTDF